MSGQVGEGAKPKMSDSMNGFHVSLQIITYLYNLSNSIMHFITGAITLTLKVRGCAFHGFFLIRKSRGDGVGMEEMETGRAFDISTSTSNCDIRARLGLWGYVILRKIRSTLNVHILQAQPSRTLPACNLIGDRQIYANRSGRSRNPAVRCEQADCSLPRTLVAGRC